MVFGNFVLNRVSILSLCLAQGIFFGKFLKQRMALGSMGTCGQSGYGFWEFCLKQGIDFITLS